MGTDVKARKRVNHERLVRFVQAAFEKLGVPNADAQIGADALVAADLRGVDTHGVIRFSPQAWYVKWLSEGSMTARPNIRIISESASTALIDGDRGVGMVMGHGAMALAWALNESARATDDPRVAQKARRLLPLGGSRDSGSHKGYGLAIVVEILCGVLTGTLTALNADQDPRGHFFGAIRIDAFRPLDEFKRDMDRLIHELKSTPPIEGQNRVYVAGEIEFETAEERTERGIPLLPSVLKGLRDVSEQLGVPYDLE